MARPLRIEYAGAIYHVTSRGDRREVIYINDEDRRLWLEIFGSVCERFNWRCHAWCLMDNHYHIVVEAIEGNLSKGMWQLNGVYTQAHNRRHGRITSWGSRLEIYKTLTGHPSPKNVSVTQFA